MDNRKISICVTTWNRFESTLNSFIKVLDDLRVESIIIVDDNSELEIYKQLEMAVSFNHKIQLYRNQIQYDCFLNKRQAISLAHTDWVVILDSDNQLDTEYLDRLYEIENWDEHTSYMPSWAKPLFKYQAFAGLTISKENVASYMGQQFFDTMLNCFNFFINRYEYLRVFKSEIDPITADSLYFNYLWFAEGNKMFVVPNMEYEHAISHDSHYKINNSRTGNLYEEIATKIKELR